jgi:hypothetical protein
MTEYGESRESLESSWETWVHHLPCDTLVGAALDRLYAVRLSKLDPQKDSSIYDRLLRKRKVLENRIQRYQPALFVESTHTGARTAQK